MKFHFFSLLSKDLSRISKLSKNFPLTKKRLRFLPFLLLFFIFCALIDEKTSLQAQNSDNLYQKNTDDYRISLGQLLQETETAFDVKITCDASFQKETVALAPWKKSLNLERRLSNFLVPLDLDFEKTGKNAYNIIRPVYYIRSMEDAKNDLDNKLKQYSDLESWKKRQTELRRSLLQVLDLSPLPEKTPLNPIVTPRRYYDGYSVENIALEVIPNFYICGSLYRPIDSNNPAPNTISQNSAENLNVSDQISEQSEQKTNASTDVKKYPAVLCPHGHSENSNENLAGRYRSDMQIRCATLARMGAIAFSYSMFAWGESQLQLAYSDHRESGFSETMQTWTTMRILDYLTSLPEIDVARIGITGESGGGTQTFLASALDERIAVAVPVVMVSAHFFGGCPCESGLPIHILNGGTCNAEIAALIAPRPLLVVSITQDWTCNVPQVEYPYLQTVYGFFNVKENVANVHLDEPHDYNVSKRNAMYPFMSRHLQLDMSKIDESKVTVETAEILKVFGKNGEKLPKTALHGLQAVKDGFQKAKPMPSE